MTRLIVNHTRQLYCLNISIYLDIQYSIKLILGWRSRCACFAIHYWESDAESLTPAWMKNWSKQWCWDKSLFLYRTAAYWDSLSNVWAFYHTIFFLWDHRLNSFVAKYAVFVNIYTFWLLQTTDRDQVVSWLWLSGSDGITERSRAKNGHLQTPLGFMVIERSLAIIILPQDFHQKIKLTALFFSLNFIKKFYCSAYSYFHFRKWFRTQFKPKLPRTAKIKIKSLSDWYLNISDEGRRPTSGHEENFL